MVDQTRPRSWWPDLAFLAGFVVLTVLLAAGHLLALDAALADWADAHRPAPIYWPLRVLNYLGQGGQVLMPVAILLAAAVTWRTRSVRPLIVFAAAFVLTYVTIGPLKIWLQRAAPHFEGPDRTHLFNEFAVGQPRDELSVRPRGERAGLVRRDRAAGERVAAVARPAGVVAAGASAAPDRCRRRSSSAPRRI